MCCLFLFVLDFYAEAVSSNHLNPVSVTRYAPILMHLTAFVVRPTSPIVLVRLKGEMW